MCSCTHGCLLYSHYPTRQPELVISSSLCVSKPKSQSCRTPQGAFTPKQSSVLRAWCFWASPDSPEPNHTLLLRAMRCCQYHVDVSVIFQYHERCLFSLSKWHVVTQSTELGSGCPGPWGQFLLAASAPWSMAQYPARESELLYLEQVVSNVMTLLSPPEPAETLWQWDYFYDLISIVSSCLIIGVK